MFEAVTSQILLLVSVITSGGHNDQGVVFMLAVPSPHNTSRNKTSYFHGSEVLQTLEHS
jgi:hypothetical protein